MTAIPDNVGFIKLLIEILGLIRTGKNTEIASLRDLASRKFDEISETHVNFLRIIRALTEDLEDAYRKLQKTDDITSVLEHLSSAIDDLMSRREEKREERRSLYHEAEIYENNMVESAGIFANVPQQFSHNLMAFMSKYCNYFEMEGVYDHRLGHALRDAATFLYHFKSTNRVYSKADFESQLSEVIFVVRAAEDFSRLAWDGVSRAYRELQFSFRTVGVNK